ncbi:hypothetical protein CERZMDRAFT_86104 [Cercospora zeae-maydis SCOH1-5]|uniref:Uncharacterized protein n=1 Tax=Cercospora zeae-maydis SCOH1-5 TaxID=717836 RepID=A0A6A6FAN9_9PEZI|nr:hypothetical protein CERZMDRAFT_86104 [Cercospora zeae-maydis SCOH1-5]
MAWFSEEHNAMLEQRLRLLPGAALKIYQTNDNLANAARELTSALLDRINFPPPDMPPATIDVLVAYFGHLLRKPMGLFYDESNMLRVFQRKAAKYEAVVGPVVGRERKELFKELQEEAEAVVSHLHPEPRVIINGASYAAWFTPEHYEWLELLTGYPASNFEKFLSTAVTTIARAAEAIFQVPSEPTITSRARFGDDDYPRNYGNSSGSGGRRSHRYPEYPSSLLPNAGNRPPRSGGYSGSRSGTAPSPAQEPWAVPPPYACGGPSGNGTRYPGPYARGLVGDAARRNQQAYGGSSRYPSPARDEAPRRPDSPNGYERPRRYELRDPGVGPGSIYPSHPVRRAREYRPNGLGGISPPRVSRSSGLSRQGAVRRPGRGLGGETNHGSGSGRRPVISRGLVSPPRSLAGRIERVSPTSLNSYGGISPSRSSRRRRRDSRERRYRFVPSAYH